MTPLPLNTTPSPNAPSTQQGDPAIAAASPEPSSAAPLHSGATPTAPRVASLSRLLAIAADKASWLRANVPDRTAELSRAATTYAGDLKTKLQGLDVRRRVADLQRAPNVTIAVPQRPSPITRLRPRLTEGWSWMSWMFVAASLFAAGVAHIVTIFALPSIGSTSAFERLRPQLPVNTMTVLPPAAPGSTHIPFLSPDVRYAMCRYDLTGGAIVVSATLPEAGWSLAIHAPDGENFYLVPGQDQRRTEIAFTITRSNERSLIATPGVRRNDVDATQVTSPRPEGLVVLRAPVRGLAFRGETETILKTATCQQRIR
jgi:uncharacterized membrane protein